MNWIYVMTETFYQTGISYLKLVSYLGLNTKLENYIPNKGFNMANMEMDGGKLMRANHIFKAFSEILLTSSVQITQIFTDIMMYKEQRITSHSKAI